MLIPLTALYLSILIFRPTRQALLGYECEGYASKYEGWVVFALKSLITFLALVIPVLYQADLIEATIGARWFVIHAVSALCLPLLLMRCYLGKACFGFKQPAAVYALIGFAISGFLTLFWTASVPLTLWYSQHYLSYVIIALTVFCIYDKSWLVRLFGVLAFSLMFSSVLGVLQFFQIGGFVEEYYVQSKAPGGFHSNRIFAAAYIVMLMPIMFALYLNLKARWLKYLLLASVFVSSVHLVLTYGRAAWLTLMFLSICGTLWFVFQPKFKGFIRKLCLPFTVMVLGVIVGVTPLFMGFEAPGNDRGSLQSHVSDLAVKGKGIGSRLAIYSNTAKGMLPDALKGIGAGAFQVVYPKYNNLVKETPSIIYSIEQRPKNLHSDAYQFLIELGLFGFLCVVSLFIWTLIAACKLIKQYMRTDIEHAAFVLLSFASLLAITICSLVDFPFHRPLTGFVSFVIIGFLMAEYKKVFMAQHKLSSYRMLVKVFYGLLLALCLFTSSFWLWNTAKHYKNDQLLRVVKVRAIQGVFDKGTLQLANAAMNLYPLSHKTRELTAIAYAFYSGDDVPLNVRIFAQNLALKWDPYSANINLLQSNLYLALAKELKAKGDVKLSNDAKLKAIEFADNAIRYAPNDYRPYLIGAHIALFDADLKKAQAFVNIAKDKSLINNKDVIQVQSLIDSLR